MSLYDPARNEHLGEEGNWPRHKPLFTLAAFFIGTAVSFAYRFKTKWKPTSRMQSIVHWPEGPGPGTTVAPSPNGGMCLELS